MGRNREGVEFPHGGEVLLMIGVNDLSVHQSWVKSFQYSHIETQMSVALVLMIPRLWRVEVKFWRHLSGPPEVRGLGIL